jgi:hypothetical protein
MFGAGQRVTGAMKQVPLKRGTGLWRNRGLRSGTVVSTTTHPEGSIFQPLLPPLLTVNPPLNSVLVNVTPKRPQKRSLFRGQDATDLEFGENPHTHRISLGCAGLSQTLFDQAFVRTISFQSFFQRPICLAHTLRNQNPFVSILFSNYPNLFALFGGEI